MGKNALKNALKKIYESISWFIYEVFLTFSNKPSFFASKRIERFALFVLAYGIIVGFVKRNWDKLTTDQMLMIVGTVLIAGGWNTIQIRKDIQNSVIKKDENKSEIVDTTKEP